MSDLISRQAAITLPVMPKEHREYQTYNLDDVYEQGWFDLQKCIEELPSAQPEQQRLSDWKEDFKGYINAIAIDLSRDDYYAIMEYIDEVPSAQAEQRTAKLTVPIQVNLPDYWVEQVVNELRNDPDFVERKKGKWVYGEDEYGIDGYHCDKCGFFVPWDYTHKFINYIEDYNFCPNCGAKMEGAES